MIYEVSCFPSPGLVSPVSAGAHRDIGKEAEREMFCKTKGVNTHKSRLFLMGIACAAAGKAIYENKGFNEMQSIIKEMTAGLVEKELVVLKDKDNLSNGERLYLKHKIRGIRGEAEEGIPTVFKFSLGFYKDSAELSINDRLVHTLLGIMQFCDDSTIIHRHNTQVLLEVQQRAKRIVCAGGMKSEQGREMIESMCHEFVEKNISPGGSADLLGVTVFLYFVEKFMDNLT